MRVKEIQLTNNLTFNDIRELIKLTSRFESEITLSDNEESYYINAKSILGLISLFAKKGTMFTITARGGDELEAVKAIGDWIESYCLNAVAGGSDEVAR